MSFKHNYLKNLFLSDAYANALFQKVMERDSAPPTLSDKTLRRAWKHRVVETDHDLNEIVATIENGDWDIGIETTRNILVYSSNKVGDFVDVYGDFHTEKGYSFSVEDDDGDELMITYDVGGSDETSMNVDVCPNLGEEYPFVLRAMKRKIPPDDDQIYVLLVDECTVKSCDWKDLVDIFDQHDIALVSFKELIF